MGRRAILAGLLIGILAAGTVAQAAPDGASIELRLNDGAGAPGSTALRILVLLTVLAVAPSILLLMTCFVRFVIALHFLRQALGTPQMPPNQVLIGLALFMTLFVMAPVLDEVHDEAWVPYNEGAIDTVEALQAASVPLKDFMLHHTRKADLALFVNMAHVETPRGPDDLPLRVVVPAFVISELRTGFEIGFLLFLPFLVIDLVVASVLLSMGMMMLPPVMVSLPFKVLLFILVDGWSLLAGSLVAGFR
ncbi:MAG: flagellar biosynthetic protein FliP [Acidobacteria bacterium]|nr:MAG: flagellar biosynthetic protein FliP [Acidobacteriota bacterium]